MLGEELSRTLAALPEQSDPNMRAQQVMGVVQGAMARVQTQLADDVGYGGDDGFVQLQAALIDHMADPSVMHATSAATHSLCARAGIPPPS